MFVNAKWWIACNVNLAKTQDNLYLIVIHLKHRSLFLFILSTIIQTTYPGTRRYNEIYLHFNHFLEYNYVSPTHLKDKFVGIGLLWHYSNSFEPRNFPNNMVSNYCWNHRYNIAQNDHIWILVYVDLLYLIIDFSWYESIPVRMDVWNYKRICETKKGLWKDDISITGHNNATLKKYLNDWIILFNIYHIYHTTAGIQV